jgi:hypothetical protein
MNSELEDLFNDLQLNSSSTNNKMQIHLLEDVFKATQFVIDFSQTVHFNEV